MSERVVAYAPSAVRLVRIVGEQSAAGSQVMAAFLNPEAAQSYAARNALPLVGEPLEAAPAFAPPAEYAAPPTRPPPWASRQPIPPPPDAARLRPGAGRSPAFAPPAGTPAPMEAMQVGQAVQPRHSGAPGQVFAVYSPRGGAGTSLIAATLASRIAANPELRVVLVDLDLQNGSQAYIFDVNEQKRCSVLSLKPLIDEILVRCEGDLSRVGAESAAVISEEILLNKTFKRDNLHILCALDDPAAIDDYVDPSSHMEALVQVLAANFDVVVLDLPNTVDMFTAPALFRSDRILVVTPEDIPSQIKVARMLNLVLAPMIEARDLVLQERCFLVVSRSSKKKLEVPMPVGVAASLADDKKFFENFVVKHMPLAKAGGGGFANGVGQLATFLGVGGAAPAKGKK